MLIRFRNSNTEIVNLLQKRNSRAILNRVKDDASSLRASASGSDEESSIYARSESVEFDFDFEVIITTTYRQAFASAQLRNSRPKLRAAIASSTSQMHPKTQDQGHQEESQQYQRSPHIMHHQPSLEFLPDHFTSRMEDKSTSFSDRNAKGMRAHHDRFMEANQLIDTIQPQHIQDFTDQAVIQHREQFHLPSEPPINGAANGLPSTSTFGIERIDLKDITASLPNNPRSPLQGNIHDDTLRKKRDSFRRALKALISKSANDHGKIEEMLVQVLGKVEGHKVAHGLKPNKSQPEESLNESLQEENKRDRNDYEPARSLDFPVPSTRPYRSYYDNDVV